ncbi:MAG: T9SS type A sorting domain-containing protein [Saprospiraceae bacterium]
MKKIISKPILLLTSILLTAVITQAQQSINSSGGNAKGSGGTLTYSVGQTVYTINKGIGGSAAQGVQHAYEILTVGSKDIELDISISVYPNPTEDKLTLQVEDYHRYNLLYQLLDLQGKLLESTALISNQTQIDMHNLPAATYFLNVVNGGNKKVQSFKIIKN